MQDASLLFNNYVVPFLLISLFGIGSLRSSASPIYNDNYCPNNATYQSSITFQTNLKLLLSSLTSNASQADGSYVTNMGLGTINVASGLFLCRGDVSSAPCQECVATAATEITRLCPNQTESLIWYDECMLGYTNTYYNPTSIVPGVSLSDDKNISTSDLDSFNQTLFRLLNRLAVEAASSKLAKKFATGKEEFTGSSSSVYGLVPCVSSLTSAQCEGCLQNAIATLPMCCGGKQGARALLTWCNIRYELYQFYNTSGRSASPPVLPPPPSEKRKGRSRTIILIVVSTFLSAMVFSFGYYLLRRKAKKSYKTILLRENFGHESANLESLQFDLAVIEAATNNFSHENKIGKGGFGEVYKGILFDGRQIAVKKLSRSSKQGANEFKNEVLLIAKLQHRNLVTFIGFSLEEQEKMLVYKYVPNKSLDYFLFDTQRQKLLSWFERHNIIGGIARGILYLHEYSRLKVIHRDLKPSNILLDENMIPKISDFGLARIVDINQDQGSTNRIVGTYGYMSPEYAMLGQFSEKSDVFSFGVMVLEIITGKKNVSSYESHCVADGLLNYVWRQWRNQTPLSTLDPNIKDSYSEIEVIKCIQIGLLCVQQNPDVRPTMVTIVSYLSSHSIELPTPQEPTFSLHDKMDPKAIAEEPSSNRSIRCSTPFSINEMSISKFLP